MGRIRPQSAVRPWRRREHRGEASDPRDAKSEKASPEKTSRSAPRSVASRLTNQSLQKMVQLPKECGLHNKAFRGQHATGRIPTLFFWRRYRSHYSPDQLVCKSNEKNRLGPLSRPKNWEHRSECSSLRVETPCTIFIFIRVRTACKTWRRSRKWFRARDSKN